jgi:hypothetical protein
VQPFQPEDAAALELQDAQAAEMHATGDWRERLAGVAAHGPTWTARIGGRVVCCAGFIEKWRGSAQAWALIGTHIPRAAWVGLHGAVRQRIEQAPALGWWRVETHVRADFPPGVRWAELLGMEREGLAQGYGPDGADHWLYARIFR